MKLAIDMLEDRLREEQKMLEVGKNIVNGSEVIIRDLTNALSLLKGWSGMHYSSQQHQPIYTPLKHP